MINRIQAQNFKCLRYIDESLQDFHILVGPNASGKTTFLDTISFLGDLVGKGLDQAIELRTQNFVDLVWNRTNNRFELAIELQIPEGRLKSIEKSNLTVVRYEVAVGVPNKSNEYEILAEKVLLKEPIGTNIIEQIDLFPSEPKIQPSILSPKASKRTKTVVNKVRGGNDNYYDETGKGWDHAFKLGPRKSALGNLPEDETKFPVATWLKGFLVEGVQKIILNSANMRSASPPGQPRTFRADGSNLPWVIDRLRSNRNSRHKEWINHLQTALPDLEDITTFQRKDDNYRYLVAKYRNGLNVPSWNISDGTLRLLALTLPAYLTDITGIYLIEEPENGIHPRAVETLFQSLSSVYSAQILVATHSTVILSIADPKQVLCFGKAASGATDIVLGSEHPNLRKWKGEENLGVLFAGGVLG